MLQAIFVQTGALLLAFLVLNESMKRWDDQ